MTHTRATSTDAEIANFHTIQSISTWAGVKPEVWAALLAVMCADGTEVPKFVALRTDEEWDALFAEVRIGDNEDKRPLSMYGEDDFALLHADGTRRRRYRRGTQAKSHQLHWQLRTVVQ